jgi:Raf kinase inhibitor-like YbhB/YbcL family protein
MNIKILSDAFDNGSIIPVEHTCDGENISPALYWSGVPIGTKSLVLIMDDPDAPVGTFTHMIMFNIPDDVDILPKEVPKDEKYLKHGIHYGINDFGRTGYGGPCPPYGTHRYYFRIYALDIMLNLGQGIRRYEVEKGMKGHILANGELMGLYKRRIK